MNVEVTEITLNKLRPWEGNPRKSREGAAMDELTASIAAHGLLQSLVVKRLPDEEELYEVIAGGRRLEALRVLADQGRITYQEPVACRVINGAHDAAEVSLAENVVREAMHPVDQFEAFHELVEKGSSVTDIAARFGVTDATVLQRLRLARVSPAVLDKYRVGALNLAMVQAMAVTDDHKRQNDILPHVGQNGKFPRYLDATDIRKALTEAQVPATDPRVKFVGVSAYEEAGGEVRKDLFCNTDEGVFIEDSALLDRVVEQQLEGEKQKLLAEGWKWVDIVEDYGYQYRHKHQLKELDAKSFAKQTPETKERIKAIKAELKPLEKEDYYDLPDADQAVIDNLNDELGRLEEKTPVFDAAVKAKAGVILTIGEHGLEIHRGLVRPDEAKEAKKEQKAKEKEKEKAKAKKAGKADEGSDGDDVAYPNAVEIRLSQHKTAAVAAVLAIKPDVALRAIVCSMVSEIVYEDHDLSALKLRSQNLLDGISSDVEKQSRGFTQLDAFFKKWKQMLPSKESELWTWCMEQEQETLLEILAFCVAVNYNAVIPTHKWMAGDYIKNANQIAAATGIDMPSWFIPTEENLFNFIPKGAILQAMKEGLDGPVPAGRDKLPKKSLAELAARDLKDSRWIPPQLRIPGLPLMPTAGSKQSGTAKKTKVPAANKTPVKKKAVKPVAKKPAAKSKKKAA